MTFLNIARKLLVPIFCFALGVVCGMFVWLLYMPYEGQRSLSQYSKAAKEVCTFDGGTFDDFATSLSLYGSENFVRMMHLKSGIGLFLVKHTSRKAVDLKTPREQGTQHFLELVNAISAEMSLVHKREGQPDSTAPFRIADVAITYCFSETSTAASMSEYSAFSETWNADKIARFYGVAGDFRDPDTEFIRVDALIPVTVRLPTRDISPNQSDMSATVTISYVDEKDASDACAVSIRRHDIRLTYDHDKDDWVLVPK